MREAMKELKKAKQFKRNINKEHGAKLLASAGYSFTSHNNGVHLVVHEGGMVIDYWPSTGKWKDRESVVYCRGINNLLNYLDGGNFFSLIATEPKEN